jgi:hypothetical protein
MKSPIPPEHVPLLVCGLPKITHGPGSLFGFGADGQLSITYVPALAAALHSSVSAMTARAVSTEFMAALRQLVVLVEGLVVILAFSFAVPIQWALW